MAQRTLAQACACLVVGEEPANGLRQNVRLSLGWHLDGGIVGQLPERPMIGYDGRHPGSETTHDCPGRLTTGGKAHLYGAAGRGQPAIELGLVHVPREEHPVLDSELGSPLLQLALIFRFTGANESQSQTPIRRRDSCESIDNGLWAAQWSNVTATYHQGCKPV